MARVSVSYKPLSAYGLVGNLETCALVGRDGAIDWCCFPEIESPSVFAAILDDEVGGRFSLQPAAAYESTQRYLQRTNVLETTARTDDGTLTLTDFMPVAGEDALASVPERSIYRKAACVDGAVDLAVEFSPRFDYARAETSLETIDGGIHARGGEDDLFLATPAPLGVADDSATGTVSLDAGDAVWFVLTYGATEAAESYECERTLDRTASFWREWAHVCTDPDRCVLAGPWHDVLVRSGLVLKLLTYRGTGAFVAAPTTSLPESIGGERNWDYRYTWLRDAAFTVQALYHLDHTAEAERYFDWCLRLLRTDERPPFEHPSRRPLYGVHGESPPPEEVLDHLSGYRDSRPVRIGNAAREQLQLDVFGELLLAISETARFGGAMAPGDWGPVRWLVDYVCDHWDEPDRGIWEVRSEPRHFVHSKVMCWAALDRGITLARANDLDAPLNRWREGRAACRDAILERGFDEGTGSFVRSFGSTAELDAACLRIPVVGFLPFDDDRVHGTIDAVAERLATDDGLVYRYDGEDGVPGDENPFVLCSCWLVDALALSGRVEEAKDVFDGVRQHASRLGLISEEVDAATGELLGNFPQALSHIGLINSALYLGSAEGRRTVPAPVGAASPISGS